MYNLDKHENASDWIGNDKGKTKIDSPKLSSFITVKYKGHDLVDGALGFFMNMSNNVYYNGTNVGMFTAGFSHKGTAGLSVLPENFYKVCALFTARKAIVQDWMNDKDEYFAPMEYL
jgi:hypothetical protein